MDVIPFAAKREVSFTRKRIIDVFLYTQYAHQGDEKRERQYAECLAQVNQKRGLLFWLFLRAMCECALHIRNAGIQIAAFTENYCRCRGLPLGVVGPATDYVRMGELEKQHERESRVINEKTEELAMKLWEQKGRPEDGSAQFMKVARELLNSAITDKKGKQGEVD